MSFCNRTDLLGGGELLQSEREPPDPNLQLLVPEEDWNNDGPIDTVSTNKSHKTTWALMQHFLYNLDWWDKKTSEEERGARSQHSACPEHLC